MGQRKVYVKGYRRRDGTYVRGYTQNRRTGSGSGSSPTARRPPARRATRGRSESVGVGGDSAGPTRRAVVILAAAVGTGALAWQPVSNLVSPPAAAGTRLKLSSTSVRLGRVTLQFQQSEIELAAAGEGERQIRLVLDVTNGEATPVLVIGEDQELAAESGETYYAVEGEVSIAPRKRARLALTFTISDQDTPRTMTLRVGRRTAEVNLSE